MRAVAAVPLDLGGSGLAGSLTVVGVSRPRLTATSGVGDVAVALTDTVLHDPNLVGVHHAGVPSLGLFEDEDVQPMLYQAAGVLQTKCGWDMDGAIALIRAHAYAEERDVRGVCDDVIRWDLRL